MKAIFIIVLSFSSVNTWAMLLQHNFEDLESSLNARLEYLLENKYDIQLADPLLQHVMQYGKARRKLVALKEMELRNRYVLKVRYAMPSEDFFNTAIIEQLDNIEEILKLSDDISIGITNLEDDTLKRIFQSIKNYYDRQYIHEMNILYDPLYNPPHSTVDFTTVLEYIQAGMNRWKL